MAHQPASRAPGPPQAQVFHIPDTLTKWPWPARTSPHIDKVKADFNASIKGYSQLEGKTPLKVIEEGETALLMCFGWLIDEITDEPDDSDVRGIRAVSDIIMDALRHSLNTRPEDEHILGEVSRQWWLRVIKEMTPISIQRLFRCMEGWLLSCVQQAKVSRSSEKETIEEYIERRSVDVAMLVSMTFVEMEADIPQYIWEDPVLETVRSLMCHMVFLDNDMFSYNKEQAQGDNNNILCIMMRDQQLSLEDAFEWANKRHRDLQEKYLQNLAKMPSWGAEIDAQVDKYIGGLGRMLSGIVKYSTSCKRYADGRERIGPRDNRIFELLPSRAKANTGTVEQ